MLRNLTDTLHNSGEQFIEMKRLHEEMVKLETIPDGSFKLASFSVASNGNDLCILFDVAGLLNQLGAVNIRHTYVSNDEIRPKLLEDS